MISTEDSARNRKVVWENFRIHVWSLGVAGTHTYSVCIYYIYIIVYVYTYHLDFRMIERIFSFRVVTCCNHNLSLKGSHAILPRDSKCFHPQPVAANKKSQPLVEEISLNGWSSWIVGTMLDYQFGTGSNRVQGGPGGFISQLWYREGIHGYNIYCEAWWTSPSCHWKITSKVGSKNLDSWGLEAASRRPWWPW